MIDNENIVVANATPKRTFTSNPQFSKKGNRRIVAATNNIPAIQDNILIKLRKIEVPEEFCAMTIIINSIPNPMVPMMRSLPSLGISTAI